MSQGEPIETTRMESSYLTRIANPRVRAFFDNDLTLDPGNAGKRIQMLETVMTGAERFGEMAEDCLASVGIPVKSDENNLGNTLEQLARQHVNDGSIEVNLLINDAPGVDITKSRAYLDAMKFISESGGNLRVTISCLNVENPVIGELRWLLASLALLRIDQARINPKDYILISNDADVVTLPRHYIQQIYDAFMADTDLTFLGGGVRYPAEVYKNNHLFFASQVFDQVLSEGVREGWQTAYGGNSAFAAGEYMEVGGHDTSAKVSETSRIRERMSYRGDHVSVGREDWMVITTSDRRISAVLAEGRNVATRHGGFMSQGDVKYGSPDLEKGPKSDFMLTERNKENFRMQLDEQVKAVFKKQIDRVLEDKQMTIDQKRVRFERINTNMRKAAEMIGVTIEFIGGNVTVRNCNGLLEALERVILQSEEAS